MLREMAQWKIFDLTTNKNTSNSYSFVTGWQITLQSVIHIWNNLKILGFKYLSLRSFNQDPLETLFGVIRQHGVCNTNPTCHQFVAALKTAVVNGMTTSGSKGNCENDNCNVLSSLTNFFTGTSTIITSADDSNLAEDDTDLNASEIESKLDLDSLENENQATAYVTGYILKEIKVPSECNMCRHLFFQKI